MTDFLFYLGSHQHPTQGYLERYLFMISKMFCIGAWSPRRVVGNCQFLSILASSPRRLCPVLPRRLWTHLISHACMSRCLVRTQTIRKHHGAEFWGWSPNRLQVAWSAINNNRSATSTLPSSPIVYKWTWFNYLWNEPDPIQIQECTTQISQCTQKEFPWSLEAVLNDSTPKLQYKHLKKKSSVDGIQTGPR